MPDIYYARPSNFLSDPRDKTIIVGESEDEVLQKMYEYLSSPAAQGALPRRWRPHGAGEEHPDVHFQEGNQGHP